MKYLIKYLSIIFLVTIVACSSDDSENITVADNTSNEDSNNTNTGEGNEGDSETDTPTLHEAFSEFSSDVDIVLLNNTTVSIETNGLPNHDSPYWSPNHEKYIDPTVANKSSMSPGYIDDFEGTFELQVSVNPQKATQSTSTSLGAIGIAKSGAVIYNQNEAGNVQITEMVSSGLDYSGAHTGPSSYHYHFEPTAFSDDDDNLVGVIADGFFLYGRKCYSTGSYPSDLDDSNGHTSITKHNSEEEYHYHIGNTTIYNEYYVNFTGDYQGTPYKISGGSVGQSSRF